MSDYLTVLLAQRDTCIQLAQLGDSRPLQRWAMAVSYHVVHGEHAAASTREVPALCRPNGKPNGARGI